MNQTAVFLMSRYELTLNREICDKLNYEVPLFSKINLLEIK